MLEFRRTAFHKINMGMIFGMAKILFLIHLLFLLLFNCRSSAVLENNTADRIKIFQYEFPLEIGQIKEWKIFPSDKAIFVVSGDGQVFEINIYNGLRKYKVDGDVKQVVDNYLLVQRGDKTEFFNSSENRIFLRSVNKYYFISLTEVVYWAQGRFIFKNLNGEQLLFTEDLEPEEIFSVKHKDKIFVFWNSENKNWWWDGNSKLRLGQYEEREEMAFYLSAGSYVAISTKDVLGDRANIRLIYGDNRQIDDFSVEILPPNYMLVRVHPGKFPVGQRVFAIYDVVPRKQDKFFVARTEKDIYFLDSEITTPPQDIIRYCQTYLGSYNPERGRFIREQILPTISCELTMSSNSNLVLISSVLPNLQKSTLFLIWSKNLIKKEDIDMVIYPFLIGDIPYIYFVYRREDSLYVNAEPISYW